MKIFATLALLITIAIILYAVSQRVTSPAATAAAEERELTAPLVSPSPSANLVGVQVTPAARSATRYKADMDAAHAAADSMVRARQEADEAGQYEATGYAETRGFRASLPLPCSRQHSCSRRQQLTWMNE